VIRSVKPFTLVGDGVVLDAPRADDIDRIAGFCADPDFERFMTTPWPYTRTHAEHFVTTYVPLGWTTGRERTWAIREHTELVGVIGLRMHSLTVADLGFWLGAPHRGRGLMSASVRLVADWAFGDGGIELLHWECVPGNVASAAVARATGFRFTGVGTAHVPSRDGRHGDAWRGERRPGDTGIHPAGWPL